MGRLIEQLAPEYDFEVALKLDEFNNPERRRAHRRELSRRRRRDRISPFPPRSPATSRASPRSASRSWSVPPAGWSTSTAVKRAVESNDTGLVWSPNFSIGVNVFFRLVAEAARLLADEPAYGAWAWEIHHSTKKDAPSGTLLKLVDEMKKAGYARNIDVGSNRAGTHRRHARNRLRFRGGHHHSPPHGPQPRRFRPGRAESRPMGRWEKGISTNLGGALLHRRVPVRLGGGTCLPDAAQPW